MPRAPAASRRSKPNYDADAKTERSEGLVEAAGVEPASENTSSQINYVRVSVLVSQPVRNGAKCPGRHPRYVSLPRLRAERGNQPT